MVKEEKYMSYHCTADFVGELRKYRNKKIVTMTHNQYCRISGKKVDWESVLNKYREIKNESIDCN